MSVLRLGKLKYLLPMLLIGWLAGCGLGPQLFRIEPDQLTDFSGTSRINKTVELRLTEDFRTYTWAAPTGLPYTLDLGDILTKNATLLCNSLFANTIVTDGTSSAKGADLVLVPHVVFLDKTQAAYSFQMVDMEIHTEWKLLDASGRTIWVDTIKGFGHEKMGGPFSFEENTRKQIRMAMSDMFSKSYAAIVNGLKFFSN